MCLCPSFPVHAAQPHHGTRHRGAQPPLCPAVPYAPQRPDGDHRVVGIAIRRGPARGCDGEDGPGPAPADHLTYASPCYGSGG